MMSLRLGEVRMAKNRNSSNAPGSSRGGFLPIKPVLGGPETA
jgi:hypothetical protein